MARRKVDVREAAELLGTSVDAVRKRVQRGSLPHEKEDGRVYVWLDDDQDTGKPKPEVEGSPELVEDLRDQVAYLRDQLDRERGARTEERRRHDTIIAQLMQRVPELEPAASSPEQGEASETAGAETEMVDTGPATAGSQTSVQRPWWRRWFG